MAQLLRLNEALRARDRVLGRALEGNRRQYEVLSQQLERASGGAGGTGEAGRGGGGSPQRGGSEGEPWAAAAEAHPALLRLMGGAGSSTGPAGGRACTPLPGHQGQAPPPRAAARPSPLPLGDSVLEGVLDLLQGAGSAFAPAPPEVLRSVAGAFRAFVEAWQARWGWFCVVGGRPRGQVQSFGEEAGRLYRLVVGGATSPVLPQHTIASACLLACLLACCAAVPNRANAQPAPALDNSFHRPRRPGVRGAVAGP